MTAQIANLPSAAARAKRLPLWAFLALGAVAAGAIAFWVDTHKASPAGPSKSALAVASASARAVASLPQPASDAATPSARADARSTQAAAQGELMVSQYRSSADARSQLLSSKDSWSPPRRASKPPTHWAARP
ncbi:MAG TPA: hypothetical protein VHW01_23880, partial [Polyangiaceae bacterium]|nr:hypothetical protein [Polyangiaceae bacterium]